MLLGQALCGQPGGQQPKASRPVAELEEALPLGRALVGPGSRYRDSGLVGQDRGSGLFYQRVKQRQSYRNWGPGRAWLSPGQSPVSRAGAQARAQVLASSGGMEPHKLVQTDAGLPKAGAPFQVREQELGPDRLGSNPGSTIY